MMKVLVPALLLLLAACDPYNEAADGCAFGTEQGLDFGAECVSGDVHVRCTTEPGELWAAECERCALEAYALAAEDCP